MIACLCRGVSDGAIHELILGGADTPRKIAAACGAGSDCGACCRLMQELIGQARGTRCREAGPSPYVELGERR